MALTTDTLRIGINKITDQVDPMGAHLNELDGRLGDGDLGVTMVNGFKNIAAVSDDLPDDFGMACMDCAKAMTKVSGSSFGTLMGISLMAVAKQTKGQTEIEWDRLPDLLQAALDAMIARGGASIGDKTMLDSLTAVIAATTGKTSAQDALAAAVEAADGALIEFFDQPCKIGRARIFGDKTKGMDDPGMVAIKSMIDCFT
ncbi:dihydroxyacetone kinase subunit L [Epibacterium ulvae]|uniref:dihydroxyacetone kinase subunit L n=1 Tax=Epibacterium ulvae TaxID=1156985 RepID=UPI0024938849|nr:dihydroxyacetone kinase subunit L [Epibacterium ulvae]